MREAEADYLGLVQYVGPSVEDGLLDARKSAEALIGLDDAIRYFVGAQLSALHDADYEIPVRIQRGSWQAIIPDTIPELVLAALGIAGTTYLGKAAEKMAENDFQDASLRAVFRKALESIQWTIRIGKHLGTLAKRKFENVRWRSGNREVGIPNDAGEVLYIPAEYLELYERMPANVLVRMTSVVTEERTLEVIVRCGRREEVESVTAQHKAVFCPQAPAELFPELEHGASFEGDGVITRGNGNTNSLGFLYKGHILTCYPAEGSIVRFKQALFLNCHMRGTITREDKYGEVIEARPRIIFTEITPLEDEATRGDNQQSLFIDEES